MKIDLSPEDKDLLASLKDLDVYKPLIKALKRLSYEQGQKVLQVNLGSQSDRDLVVLKAQYEGAEKLVHAFEEVVLKLARRSDSKN